MRIVLLQEAMMAGPFLIVMLLAVLGSVIAIYFLGIKALRLKEEIKELAKTDDEKQLKEKRTQFFFFASIILMLAIAIVMTLAKLINIKFD